MKRLVALPPRFVRESQQPKRDGAERFTGYSGILPEAGGVRAMAGWIIERGGKFHVPQRRGQFAAAERRHGQGLLCLKQQGRLAAFTGQRAQFLGQFQAKREFRAGLVMEPQAPDDWKQSRFVGGSSAEIVGAGVGLLG